VDLTDPDIQFLTTPRATNYVVNYRETGGLKVKDFLTIHQVQLAINANFSIRRTIIYRRALPWMCPEC